MSDELFQKLKNSKYEEIEVFLPDMAGIARGKILPVSRFLDMLDSDSLRLPEATLCQTVTGDFADDNPITADRNRDMCLRPIPESLRPVPWYEEPTAQVICRAETHDGEEISYSSRAVLRHVLDLYAAEGWKVILAPELEFYLTEPCIDPDLPLKPAPGTGNRMSGGRQAYGIDAVNRFDPIADDLYDFCDAQGLEIDTLMHEVGEAQLEINFNHGDPLNLADQVFLFKRSLREAAHKHGIHATFMAKPMRFEPGSAMHVHQSVVDLKTGKPLFADDDGKDTPLFHAHIAGLQRYVPSAMPLFAPYVNSYRRIEQGTDAPINTQWGYDNRTAGFRVPADSRPSSRRVENRVPGADVNPYLGMAASLACGYLGMKQGLTPGEAMQNCANESNLTLPLHLIDALAEFAACPELQAVLGQDFSTVFQYVKQAEIRAYRQVISPWEREFLMPNV